jgi:hypothetical protein
VGAKIVATSIIIYADFQKNIELLGESIKALVGFLPNES